MPTSTASIRRLMGMRQDFFWQLKDSRKLWIKRWLAPKDIPRCGVERLERRRADGQLPANLLGGNPASAGLSASMIWLAEFFDLFI